MHAERVRNNGTPDLAPRPRLRCRVDGCERPHNAKGLCTTHGERMRRTGSVADPVPMPPLERFQMYLRPGDPGDCWEWSGPRTGAGYGVLVSQGRRDYGHRFAYELAFGSIPPGALVMHSCDNPPCCNPAHLSLGSDWGNALDKVAKGRQSRGEAVASSRLTADSVRSIRADFRCWRHGRASRSNAVQLAQRFGVSVGTVHSVVRRTTWAWLD